MTAKGPRVGDAQINIMSTLQIDREIATSYSTRTEEKVMPSHFRLIQYNLAVATRKTTNVQSRYPLQHTYTALIVHVLFEQNYVSRFDLWSLWNFRLGAAQPDYSVSYANYFFEDHGSLK
jgi:hypothetical protein